MAVPPGFKENFFHARNLAIHYLEGPDHGPPLILLHGTARDWNSFSPLLPHLSQSCHLLVPDLRGHGASGRLPRGYQLSQFAGDICEFVQATGSTLPSVFGHSLGGVVALTVASRVPVRAVIVGDSMLSPQNLAQSLYQPLFAGLHDLLIRGGSVKEIAVGIGEIRLRLSGVDEPIPIRDLAGNTPAVLEEWARSALHTDPDVLKMTIDGSIYTGWSADSILPRVDCPVLLLQGNPELDALLTDADVARARFLLPRVEHIKFPLLGHALFMQRPEPVLKAITEFLGRQPVASEGRAGK